MPVELSIVETVTELETTVVEVVLESASAPGPAGPGVASGGTAGQVLTKDSGTDFDTSWQDPTGGGGGAPDDATYLVTTAHGDLSDEVVVGATPGGELGGTWASPTVDATHSGSTHAAVQAAAEATAAAALSAHLTDSSDAHDASAISSVAAGGLAATDVQAALNELDTEKAAATHAHAGEDITSGTVADARIASTIARDSEVTSAISTSESGQVRDGDAAGGVLGGTYPNPSFAADMATQAELDAHVNDTSAAHAASAISADSTTLVGTGTDVQAVFEELDNAIVAAEASTAAHIADTSAAHAASAVSVSSTTLSGTGTDVQAVFEEIDNLLDDHSSRHENGGADEISIAGLDGTPTELTNHLNDSSDAHDASAISVLDTNGDYTATDVEGVLAEIAPQLGGGGGLFDAYALIRDEKAAGTNGGTLTAGSWQTRELNTELFDPDGIVSISSNQFTLQAGTYFIRALGPSHGVERHKLKIRDITNSADLIIGTSEFSGSAHQGPTTATLIGRITLAGATALELQHRSEATAGTVGLGVAANFGVVEVYAQIEIWREA